MDVFSYSTVGHHPHCSRSNLSHENATQNSIDFTENIRVGGNTNISNGSEMRSAGDAKHRKDIQTKTYPNGFRIIYQYASSKIPVSHIYAFCDVGPVYEPDNLRGVSHFIEHMCFKGTNKTPDLKNLFKTYDSTGAYFNAYTKIRYTAYTLKCDDDHIDNNIRIMADMILDSKFDKKEFRKEEMVVIEENIQDSDDPIQKLNEEMNAFLYKGSSFEMPIDHINYHKTKYDYDKVLDFYQKMYQPSRIVLSVISNIPFSRFCHFLKKTLFVQKKSTCGITPIIHYYITPENLHTRPLDNIPIKLISKKQTNTTHFYIGFRTQTVDKYILNTLKHILSSTFNSRLFFLLREKEGLTYTSRAYVDYNELYGGFYIYAETDNSKIIKNTATTAANKTRYRRRKTSAKFRKNYTKRRGNRGGKSETGRKGVLPIIIDLLYDLIHNGVTKEEVAIIKGYLKGSMKMALSNMDRIVTHNGTQMLLYPEKPITPFIKLYDTFYKPVTKSLIDRVIRKYFIVDNMFICMIGDHLPNESKIRQLCKPLHDMP